MDPQTSEEATKDCIAVILCFSLLFLFLITYIIFKYQDKMLSLMIMFLNMSVMSLIISYTIDDNTNNIIIQVLPSFFLSLSIHINVVKWHYYQLKIDQAMIVENEQILRRIKRLERMKYWVVWFKISVLAVTVLCEVYKDDHPQIDMIGPILNGLDYLVFLSIFIKTIYNIRVRLILFFKEFYDQNCSLLFIAWSGLIYSLLVRGVEDATNGQWFDEFHKEHPVYYQISKYLVVWALPQSMQIQSLIFGYIRYKEKTRMLRQLAEQGSANESDQELFEPSLFSRMTGSTGRDTNEIHEEMSFECHVADIFFEKNNHLKQKPPKERPLQRASVLSRGKTIKDFNKTLNEESCQVKFEYQVSPTDTTFDQHQNSNSSLLKFDDSEQNSLSLANSSYLEDTIDCKQ